MTAARGRPAARRGPVTARRACRRPLGPPAEASGTPQIVSVDDYLAGRCDRLGADVVLDLAPERHPGRDRLPGTVDTDPSIGLQEIARVLIESAPDLVWVRGAPSELQPRSTRLATILNLCRCLQLPTVLMTDDIDDIDEPVRGRA